MKRLLKVPDTFLEGTCATKKLRLNDASILETCIHGVSDKGTMIFRDHALIMQLKGEAMFRCGNQTFHVGEKQMILMKSTTVAEFKRASNIAGAYECVMVCIKGELLNDFVESQHINAHSYNSSATSCVYPIGDVLEAFALSLKPYFHNQSPINEGLLRLKIKELFFGIMESNRDLFAQILQLYSRQQVSIQQIIEQHYLSPLTINEMAYLAGRSLSSFKRDFHSVFGTSPARWVREQRLKKAHELLSSSAKSVSEVCYACGFESPSHFSHLFKRYYGVSPSQMIDNNYE